MNTFPTQHKALPKKAAKWLWREHRKNRRSWRNISTEEFNGKIHFATLCHIAKSKGKYFPKDSGSIEVLTKKMFEVGMLSTRRTIPRSTDLFDMTEDALRRALIERTTMPEPTYDPKVLKAFLKACKRKPSLGATA